MNAGDTKFSKWMISESDGTAICISGNNGTGIDDGEAIMYSDCSNWASVFYTSPGKYNYEFDFGKSS